LNILINKLFWDHDGKVGIKKNAPAPLERFGKNLGMFGNVWEKIGKNMGKTVLFVFSI
jgi:hypothetical protein